MTISTLICILIIITYITISLLGSILIIRLRIIPKTRQVQFAELLLILNTTIDTEIQSYENSIFQQRGNITNSNYENFYHDLVDHVLIAIPENFYRNMSCYMTKDAVITLICRRIHTYLQEKVYKES